MNANPFFIIGPSLDYTSTSIHLVINNSFLATTMDKRSRYPTQVYLLFDERMTLHKPLISTENLGNDENSFQAPVENSSRITSLYKTMMDLEKRLMSQREHRHLYLNPYLHHRFIPLQPEPCPRATIELVHSAQHYDQIQSTAQLSDDELRALTVDNDLYFCRDTFLAASLACGGVVQCVDAVMNAHDNGTGPTRAIALVRPPGHHATRDEAMGK
jgi:acetoin utilization deacetylase AcuC-like enzyme